MKSSALTVSQILEKRLFRIPDYQRGYAWETKQISQFWEDIILTMRSNTKHYMGVIIAQNVKKSVYKHWEDDKDWKYDLKNGFRPYYLIDGQQRLITFLILIQCLIEIAKSKKIELDKDSLEDIESKYIMSMNGTLCSYTLLYRKDQNGNECLKRCIFGRQDSMEFNAYSKRMKIAKSELGKLVKKHLSDAAENETAVIQSIYSTLVKRFVFQFYEVGSDMDVNIAFESINNRGKELSTLELLKNRLIYLSTLFPQALKKEKDTLRIKINDAWKDIYKYLGNDEGDILPDDIFLKNHWFTYFPYNRNEAKAFKTFLLEVEYHPRRIHSLGIQLNMSTSGDNWPDDDFDLNSENENEDYDDNRNSLDQTSEKNKSKRPALTIAEIDEYVESLRQSAEKWFYIHNPDFPRSPFDSEERKWLRKLHRLRYACFEPIILVSSFINENRVDLFKEIEKYIFLVRLVSHGNANADNAYFYTCARKLNGRLISERKKEMTISSIVSEIQQKLNERFYPKKFVDKIDYSNNEGFYSWKGIHYFLYEYDQHIFESKKHESMQQQIEWKKFVKDSKGSSIEHIYPQKPIEKDWPQEMNDLSEDKKKALQNSLGNLLALKGAKNSSLQNFSFKVKCTGIMEGDSEKTKPAYRDGSCSEREIVPEGPIYTWDIDKIRNRGMKLLGFLEDNWDVHGFLTEDQKDEILGGAIIQWTKLND